MKHKDVTDKVTFDAGSIDSELIPIQKCVCGHDFGYGWGDFIISIYSDDAYACPVCGAKLWFTTRIRVFQVEE